MNEYNTCCNNCRNNCCREINGRNCQSILESIALEEAGIAHILNAEGEKIQKSVSIATNIDCLLEVNQSVIKTLVYITHLEQTLYRKMEQVLHECSGYCPNNCRSRKCDCGEE